MKERPILFSGPMVRAILAGRKTQTRRAVKPQPVRGNVVGEPGWHWDPNSSSHHIWREGEPMFNADWLPWGKAMCPYGAPGDGLWVRETFYCDHYLYPQIPAEDAALVRDQMMYYRATGDGIPEAEGSIPWRPSIHMPRWASRLTLEIVNVRVERVQEISLDDIQSEGVTQELIDALIDPVAGRQKVLSDHWVNGADDGSDYCHRCCVKQVKAMLREKPDGEFQVDGGWGSEHDSIPICGTCGAILSGSLTDYGAQSEIEHFLESGLNLRSPDDCYCLQRALAAGQWDPWPWPEKLKDYEQECDAAKVLNARRLGWRILWDSINAKRGLGWDANPWVWVVEFQRADPATDRRGE